MSAFRKAVKFDAKLRLALCGPAGSGKTYSILSIASELVGPGGRIAYVDTEHGSASKYADLFDFDVIEPELYDPRELVQVIDAAAEEGYSAICIDSLSHYWMGRGGELEMVDAVAKRSGGSNSFAAWKTVTPYHTALVDKMLAAQIHVMATMRTKTDWVIEKDDRGKNVPRKIGLAPVMRDGIEFEFDVCGDLDQDNTLSITKSRCPELAGKAINRPGKELARTLKAWLAAPAARPVSVAVPYEPSVEQIKAEAARIDTGGAPVGTTEAAQAVARRKLGEFDYKVMLGEFAAMKARLTEAGAEGAYYRVLGEYGYEHANAIRTKAEGARVYKRLLEQEKAIAGLEAEDYERAAIAEEASA